MSNAENSPRAPETSVNKLLTNIKSILERFEKECREHSEQPITPNLHEIFQMNSAFVVVDSRYRQNCDLSIDIDSVEGYQINIRYDYEALCIKENGQDILSTFLRSGEKHHNTQVSRDEAFTLNFLSQLEALLPKVLEKAQEKYRERMGIINERRGEIDKNIRVIKSTQSTLENSSVDFVREAATEAKQQAEKDIEATLTLIREDLLAAVQRFNKED